MAFSWSFILVVVLSTCAISNAQRAGGGSSGGGRGSGHSHSRSSRSHHNQCSIAHCVRCDTFNKRSCAKCKTGFYLDGFRKCISCGPRCDVCDLSGPGNCDVCAAGSVLVGNHCEPCAAHCQTCDDAGPGSCDICVDGFYIEDNKKSKECAACSPGCRICTDSSPAGCTACFRLYSLSNGAGGSGAEGCHFRWFSVSSLAALGAAAVVALQAWWSQRRGNNGGGNGHAHRAYVGEVGGEAGAAPWLRRRWLKSGGRLGANVRTPNQLVNGGGVGGGGGGAGEARRRDGRGDHSSEAVVARNPSHGAGPSDLVRGAPYPSGAWRGYYRQGDSEHGVATFNLVFAADGALNGAGTDDVGQYTINGRWRGGRIAFTKQYIADTANEEGESDTAITGNEGHAVEYRGEPAALNDDDSPALSCGVRGTWSLRAGGYDQGKWHVWPIMDQWQNDDNGNGSFNEPSTAAAAADESSHDDDDDGNDREGWLGDNECCICFEAAMAVKLVPCGHVALCARCAHRLQPPKCPLCRKNFTAVRALQRSSQRDATMAYRLSNGDDGRVDSNKKEK